MTTTLKSSIWSKSTTKLGTSAKMFSKSKHSSILWGFLGHDHQITQSPITKQSQFDPWSCNACHIVHHISSFGFVSGQPPSPRWLNITKAASRKSSWPVCPPVGATHRHQHFINIFGYWLTRYINNRCKVCPTNSTQCQVHCWVIGLDKHPPTYCYHLGIDDNQWARWIQKHEKLTMKTGRIWKGC